MPDQRGVPRTAVVVVVVIVEVLVIGYLITQAFRADDWTKPWYAVGAAGLSMLTGVIGWTRLRRDSRA